MKHVFKYLFVLSCLYSLPGYKAQQLYFKSLSAALNLPSNECYNVIQDRKGYIWIGTEAGLCRYNGNSIKVYNKQNGLPENAVYFMREAANGTIDIITSKNRILAMVNDTLKEAAFNSNYLSGLREKQDISYSLDQDKKGNLVVNAQNGTYEINLGTHAINFLIEKNSYHSDAPLIFDLRKGNGFLVRNRLLSSWTMQLSSFFFDVDVITEKERKRITVFFKGIASTDFRMKVCRVKNYTFFNIHNKLIRIDSLLNYTVYDFPSLVLSLHGDGEGGLWVGTFQRGLFYYSDVAAMQKPQRGLSGFSVSGVETDHEGGTWCSTLEKGVFYCNSKYVGNYSNIPELRKSAVFLKYENGQVFTSSEFDRFFTVSQDTVIGHTFHTISNCDLMDMTYDGTYWYFSTKGSLTKTDRDFNNFRFIRTRHNNNPFFCQRLDTCRRGAFGILRYDYFKIVGDEEAILLKKTTSHPLRDFKIWNDSTALAGASDGLFRFSLANYSSHKISGINAPVTKILLGSGGRVFIATSGEGLFILHGDSAEKLMLHRAVQPEIIFDLAEDRYGTLWIATNNALIRVDARNVTEDYTTANGLPANEVNKLAASPDFIYVSTSEGLCFLPLTQPLVSKVAPAIYTGTLTVNGRVVNHHQKQLVFPYNENSLEVVFDVLTYKRGSGPILSYRLSGNDTTLKMSMQNELRFDNLSPGDYELLAYAVNNSGARSSQPARLKFVILPPFWQTGWFLVICLLVFFMLVFFVARSIIRNIRHKEAEKTRINKLIAESQLTALQAQMNPHFIFNAINSIQNYILKKEEEEAYTYLNKFSRLIRIVLNNSKENTITLHEELETLRLYVELEQLRFKNSFEFSCTIAEGVDEFSVQMPVLLIQPYIENAIGHGLMNLGAERKGCLRLDISEQGGLLRIIVEDNGIGRSRAQEYKKANAHRPVAMNLIEQRLEMIDTIEDYKGIHTTITDLYNVAGNATGTRVEVFLPLTT